MGKDMNADDTDIVQVTFTNNDVTESSVGIHAKAQCLDGYEIKAMQVDEQPRVESVTELDFTATENRDYVIKVYYQSLIEQKELTETFTTTVDSIETQNDTISTLADTTDVTPTPDIVTTPDGYTFVKSTGKIAGYTEQPGVTRIDIPETIEGVEVKEIGPSAFSNRNTLIEVNMPDTVTSLGNWAFANCINLERIHLSTSLKSIGVANFINCEKLSAITIPTSLTYIGVNAFANSGLIEITFSNVNINIDESSIISCPKLKKISFYNSSVSMESNAFSSNPALMTVNIIDSVINKGEFMFGDSNSLSEVNIQNSIITTLEFGVFRSHKIPKVIIPLSTKNIMSQAFSLSDTLTTVYLPDSIEYIYEKPFNRCPNFSKAIVLMNNPKKINIPNDSPLLMLDNAPDITAPLEWYRIVSVGNINVKQNTIHSIANKGKAIDLEDIFEDRGVKETIYQGKTGTELYAGDDIEVPENYYGTDASIQYQLLGTPTSHDTKIIDNQLHIGADETSDDLRLTATLLNTTTQEVPIKISPLSAIEIIKEPAHQYIEGDYYNPDGLVIKLIYSDGYEETIAYNEDTKKDFTFTYQKLDLHTTRQIIEYEGMSVEQKITVLSKYVDTVLKDEENQITVQGLIERESELIVQKIDNSRHPELDDKKIIGEYTLEVTGNYLDEMLITFDVGIENNGKEIYVKYLDKDGQFVVKKVVVVNGHVNINTAHIASFILYMGEDVDIPEINIHPIINSNIPKGYDAINNQGVRVNRHIETSDKNQIIEYFGCMILGAVMIYIVKKRKFS